MNMTLSELMPLAPVLIVCLTTVLVMLVVSIKRNHTTAATTAVVGLNIALVVAILQFVGMTIDVQGGLLSSLVSMVATEPAFVSSLFVIDAYALFYIILILIGSLACCTLAHAYIDGYQNNREELYLMLLMAVIGAMLMVSSQNLTSFFLSLELLSVPTYGLLAYTHERNKSLESGLKYLVLSATASAAMLMGMAFLYAFAGSMQFQLIGVSLVQALDNPLMILGMALIVFAVAFKLSLFPFHAWTADVYQGAPAPIATFLATVSKVAVLALMLRFFFLSGTLAIDSIHMALTVIAVLSIIIGNLLAVRQVNLKRLLAFSSIAHLGYLMVAILCLGTAALPTVGVYLVAYLLTTIGAMGVVALMSSPYHNDEAESLADYRGLFWRRPVLTAVLTVMLLSLAGIPLTAGFIAKFFVILAAVQNMSWFLAAMVIVGSAIGLYYYLRVMVVLYMTPPDSPRIDAQGNWGSQVGGVMVLLATLLVLILGIYPSPMIAWSLIAEVFVQ
ncbi:MAG: NADH-quinone oxidoreductase subunit NuoN [Pseudomonadota bacterium]|nr:NADH-quinone oxidoreductase subunit NuoN [Pseudomonadota bacterium]